MRVVKRRLNPKSEKLRDISRHRLVARQSKGKLLTPKNSMTTQEAVRLKGAGLALQHEMDKMMNYIRTLTFW